MSGYNTGIFIGRPGPAEVELATVGTYFYNPRHFYDQRDYLVALHQEWHERVRVITQVINGDWHLLWPELSNTPQLPAIDNTINQVASHWAALFGSQQPQLKVPVPANRNVKGGQRAASKRERRLRELWAKSNIPQVLSQIGTDFVTTGSAVLGAWYDTSEPDPAARNPYILRFDPRHCYPLVDSKGSVTEMLVARCQDPASWLREHPEYKELFNKTTSQDFEEWYWYMEDRFMYCVADVSKKGREENRFVILADIPNPMGMLPVWEIRNTSADGQRRGMLDQAIGPLRHAHLLSMKRLQAIDLELFAPNLVYNLLNPDETGPGSVVQARSPDARFERLEQRTTFDATTAISQIQESIRSESAFPQQLQGDPGAAIASARGINAVQGQIDAKLAYAHRQVAYLLEKVSMGLLAVDEHFCYGDKTIYGDDRERKAPEEYNPERDVAGNYEVKVSYGIGIGSDPSSKELRLNVHKESGAISVDMYREQLGYIESGEREDMRIMREQLTQATMQGILMRIGQGEIGPMVKEVLELMSREDSNKEEVLEKLVDILNVPAQQPQGPDQQQGMGVPGVPRNALPPSGLGQQGMDPGNQAIGMTEALARGGTGGTGGPGGGFGGGRLPLPPRENIMSGNRGALAI